LFGHAEVDNVDNVCDFGARLTDEEIVWFDISVDEILFVDSLDAGQHLFSDHDDGLDGEAAVAVVEEVFQGRTEEVNDEDVV